MARLFLSSTFEDLKSYRQAAYETLRRLGHEVVGLESYAAADERPLDRSLADIGSSDVYVGILAWRYGYIPPGETMSVTELEYRRAQQLGKPTLMFVLQDTAPWPTTFVDLENAERIQAFRGQVERERLVGHFASVEEFTAKLNDAAHAMLTESGEFSRVVGVEHLPLAWRLVVASKAKPDLLLHLDPSRFAEAFEAWERENGAKRDLPLAIRLAYALTELEAQQQGEAPSSLWLAWMQAIRPAVSKGEPA